jgi:hypothetical protein
VYERRQRVWVEFVIVRHLDSAWRELSRRREKEDVSKSREEVLVLAVPCQPQSCAHKRKSISWGMLAGCLVLEVLGTRGTSKANF